MTAVYHVPVTNNASCTYVECFSPDICCPARAAAHIVMLNGYDGYLPNTTIETTVNGQSQLFYGNSNGPSFESGNYPLVLPRAPGTRTYICIGRLLSCLSTWVWGPVPALCSHVPVAAAVPTGRGAVLLAAERPGAHQPRCHPLGDRHMAPAGGESLDSFCRSFHVLTGPDDQAMQQGLTVHPCARSTTPTRPTSRRWTACASRLSPSCTTPELTSSSMVCMCHARKAQQCKCRTCCLYMLGSYTGGAGSVLGDGSSDESCDTLCRTDLS